MLLLEFIHVARELAKLILLSFVSSRFLQPQLITVEHNFRRRRDGNRWRRGVVVRQETGSDEQEQTQYNFYESSQCRADRFFLR